MIRGSTIAARRGERIYDIPAGRGEKGRRERTARAEIGNAEAAIECRSHGNARLREYRIVARESLELGETASKADLYLEEDRGRSEVWRMHTGRERESEGNCLEKINNKEYQVGSVDVATRAAR